MIRMYARRLSAVGVNAGVDGVLFGLSLPSGSRINNIRAEIHMNHAASLDFTQCTMYAVEGWILPVLDPDAGSPLNTLFDTLVPKDTDVEVIDLDTGAIDSTSFYEPGEPDWTALVNVGLKPERIYHHARLLTPVRGSIYTARDGETPFALEWVPGGVLDIRIRKNYAVSQPSVLVFAFANPALDDTTSTAPNAASETEWGQTKYIGHVLERAMLHLFGITEAGAETPWEEATALLKKHLEPDPYELATGDFAAATFQVKSRAIIDHSVEGRLGQTVITTN